MKKHLFGLLSTMLPLISQANGVNCQIVQPLSTPSIAGLISSFSAICSNVTKNRNYTDFAVLNANQPGIVSVTTSCGKFLPVGGSCLLQGSYRASSNGQRNFVLGLHYGGTDYPRYMNLTFSTIAKTLVFEATEGPYGGDIAAAVAVPNANNQGNSVVHNFYILGSLVDEQLANSGEIYFYNGSKFTATNFPLGTQSTEPLAPMYPIASNSLGELYIAAGSSAYANDVWRYTHNTWASTGLNNLLTSDDKVVGLTVNNRAYAVTQNQQTDSTALYEYDSTQNTWVNTNFNERISNFTINNLIYYAISNTDNTIYIIANNAVYYYTPVAIVGMGTWHNSNFPTASGLYPINLSHDASGNVYAGASTLNPNDSLWQYQPTLNIWSSTSFPGQIPLSYLAGTDFYAVGTANNIPQLYQFITSSWNDLDIPPSTQIILQSFDRSGNLYVTTSASSSDTLQIFSYQATNWITQNFPSQYNVTVAELLAFSTAQSPNLLALLANGLYELQNGLWSEANTGLTNLTTNYTLFANGTLFTLNARQASSVSCATLPGYNSIWNGSSSNNGFIDVFNYSDGNQWATTSFPYVMQNSYLYSPLVSSNNILYASSMTQDGTSMNVWSYQQNLGWTSLDYPNVTAGLISICAQDPLLATSNSLYVITQNGTNFNVFKYTPGPNWTNTGELPGRILQLVNDSNNNIYAIVGTQRVYRLDAITQIWSDTGYPFAINGSPEHLFVDSANNVYAVGPLPPNGNSDVIEFFANTHTWASSSLGFPSAQAGVIYRDVFANTMGNIYARTVNDTNSVESVWEYVQKTSSWRNLGLLSGYPTGTIINDMQIDDLNNIFLATSTGMYIFAGTSWFNAQSGYITQFLLNNKGSYYSVTNNAGVYKGALH